MTKRIIKNIILLVILFLVGYNSIYFKKLDEVKSAAVTQKFDAVKYARNYYNRLLPTLDKSIEVNSLLSQINTDKAKAFDAYSHALGIGNIKYFLVKGQGLVMDVNEDNISLSVKADSSNKTVQIATEYVFGNAIRDASGLIDINEFKSTMDFNNVSAEVNKIIRSEVLPAFKSKVKKGDMISFIGAIELNKEHLDIEHIELMPIVLKITP
jgi:predicted lipoprotein